MLRMILSDFDGTLFPKEDSKLKEEFVIKIKRLTDCGLIFAVNSGRPYHTLRQMLKPIENRTVFICNDGAQIMYKNCLLFKCTIPREAALALGSLTLELGSAPFAALKEKTLPITQNILLQKGLFNQDIYKLVIIKNKLGSSAILNIKEKAVNLGLRLCYEDCTYIEFCNKEANKGNATAYIKTRFGISSGIAAFGDGDNDLPMFEQSDLVFLLKSDKKICYPGARVIENMQEYVAKEL